MTIIRPYRSEDREEERIIELAYVRGVGPEQYAAEYPAHLHIDLLPQAQGQGAGRRLSTASGSLRSYRPESAALDK